MTALTIRSPVHHHHVITGAIVIHKQSHYCNRGTTLIYTFFLYPNGFRGLFARIRLPPCASCDKNRFDTAFVTELHRTDTETITIVPLLSVKISV